MAESAAIFPETEFRERCDRLRAEMAERGLDALLLTTEPDILYVTGFLTRFWESPARPWFVVVPARGDPVAVIPAIGADLMARTWVSDIRTWDAPHPDDDGVTLLAGTLREAVPAGGCIGLPMGRETHLRMPLSDYERLSGALEDRRLADATDTLHRTREIKSEAEIGLIRETCEIAGRAFARLPHVVTPRQPLDAVFAAFQVLLIEEGADWIAYLAGGAGPGGYGDVISPANDRPLKEGDILMLDTGAVRQGYFCDFDRNFAIGQPDDAARRAHAALFAATEAALAELRPGLRALDAHAMLRDHILGAGQKPLGGRLGHGLGLSLTEWPSFTDWDETPLREGMVLTLEPGVEIAPGRIMVHEENVVLRAGGCELLSPRAPEDLPVIPA